MQKKFFILTVFLYLFSFSSCDDKDNGSGVNTPEPKDTTWIQQIYPLADTKWQVSKVIHTETGIERSIFVGDEVFTLFVPTLDFETDTTGSIYLNNAHIYYDFNLSDDLWIKKDDAVGISSHIGELIYSNSQKERWMGPKYNRYYGRIGYKLEEAELNLYFHDDGFFYFDENGITAMYGFQFGPEWEVKDSNWYNCVVFEEIE